MDRSSYELAKHVMQFLPRSDTETIAKAAKQRHDLQNWKLAAAEHVEKHFLHDYTSHEMSLEHLVIYCFGLDNEKLVDIFGSLFLQKRSMPLRIEVYTVFFDKKTVEAFIDKWMNADVVCGAKKTFTWPWTLCCHGLGDKYNPVAGHIAHPNKRASIMLKHAVYEDEQNELSIVKFEPWHLQVKFAWLDALIKKWKAGDGLHIYRGRKSLYVDLEPEDWLKLVKKCTSKIEHPSGFTSLMVYKNMYNFVEIHVKLNEMDCSDFEMLLSEWNSGNGDVLSNGLKKIAVKMDLATLRWLHIKQRSNAGRIFVHRNKNSRLMVEEIDRFPGWVGARISVLDHEIVSDWNLSLLFDSMEV
ncbi:hypothetical protein QR680_003788 [Steinernema hermaphroditum]|uniref:Uncharacterized protein n=1 Tax=Steinernema hermaphroditum TaxID=289476 RepID=A0AA39HLK0_9BILA|nr:hypothetical protein QR680_003788 [Steinernema hermaphroditum]